MRARIELVVNLRMNSSNVGDVGQIRRRNGTSIKRMTNAEALKQVRLRNESTGNECDSHADNADDNENHVE